MTLINETINEPMPPACPNCGAIGALRPVIARDDARSRIDSEFRCVACDVVIIRSAPRDGARDDAGDDAT